MSCGEEYEEECRVFHAKRIEQLETTYDKVTHDKVDELTPEDWQNIKWAVQFYLRKTS